MEKIAISTSFRSFPANSRQRGCRNKHKIVRIRTNFERISHSPSNTIPIWKFDQQIRTKTRELYLGLPEFVTQSSNRYLKRREFKSACQYSWYVRGISRTATKNSRMSPTNSHRSCYDTQASPELYQHDLKLPEPYANSLPNARIRGTQLWFVGGFLRIWRQVWQLDTVDTNSWTNPMNSRDTVQDFFENRYEFVQQCADPKTTPGFRSHILRISGSTFVKSCSSISPDIHRFEFAQHVYES